MGDEVVWTANIVTVCPPLQTETDEESIAGQLGWAMVVFCALIPGVCCLLWTLPCRLMTLLCLLRRQQKTLTWIVNFEQPN